MIECGCVTATVAEQLQQLGLQVTGITKGPYGFFESVANVLPQDEGDITAAELHDMCCEAVQEHFEECLELMSDGDIEEYLDLKVWHDAYELVSIYMLAKVGIRVVLIKNFMEPIRADGETDIDPRKHCVIAKAGSYYSPTRITGIICCGILSSWSEMQYCDGNILFSIMGIPYSLPYYLLTIVSLYCSEFPCILSVNLNLYNGGLSWPDHF